MRTTPFAAIRSLFAISDEQAMWRVQTQDDEVAFAQLVRRWEGPIQRLCLRMTGDHHRGEDLTQEAFARVFARRNDYQPTGRFSTWLWRIAVNLCYDELRRRQRRGETTLVDENDNEFAGHPASRSEEPAPDELLVERERGEMVRRALMKLPETYRSVLIMRHYENLKFREIGDILEIPEGTVKSRMAEGLAQLSRLLKSCIGADEPIDPTRNRPLHLSLTL